jgi:hypothetical protein
LKILAIIMTVIIRLPLIAFLIVVFSCHDNPEPASNCKPTGARLSIGPIIGPDSVQYVYNASAKLEKIMYYAGPLHSKTDYLDYNVQDQLIKVRQQLALQTAFYNTWTLDYNAAGQVATVKVYGFSANDPPIETRTYTYDSKGRIETMTNLNVTRFEYDDADNVMKIFYKVLGFGPAELLGRENHSFDSNPRFFANVPELRTLNVYINRYEPSKNNATATTISMPDYSTKFPTPKNITYYIEYDGDNVTSIRALPSDPSFEGNLEMNFFRMSYSCP